MTVFALELIKTLDFIEKKELFLEIDKSYYPEELLLL